MRTIWSVGLVLGLVAGLLSWSALPAPAQISFGARARSAAMGEAGLALPDSPLTTTVDNPAVFAMMRKGFSIRWPSLDLRNEGTSLSEVFDWMSATQNLGSGDVVNLALQLAARPAALDLASDMGIHLGVMEAAARGEGRITVTPNSTLMTWANTFGHPVTPPDGSSALVQGGATMSLPTVGLGFRMGGGAKQDTMLGMRLRFLRSIYHEQTVTWTGGVPSLSPEIDYRDDSDWGMDLGILSVPKSGKGASLALVVTNLRKPTKLRGLQEETVVNVGTAFLSKAGHIAVDVSNVTGAYGENAQLHAGIEFRPAGAIAFRAGFSSKGTTLGLGLGGFNVAWVPNTPLIISNAINF